MTRGTDLFLKNRQKNISRGRCLLDPDAHLTSGTMGNRTSPIIRGALGREILQKTRLRSSLTRVQ